MPELPEVETTKRGIAPFVINNQLVQVSIFNSQLRWVVPDSLPQMITNKAVLAIKRRAKYLLFEFDTGAMMIHLGMSGSLRISNDLENRKKHDHVIFLFSNGICLHYHDPRRFGSILWINRTITGDLDEHPLLNNLGPEPLSEMFSGEYLYKQSRHKKTPVKLFLMNNAIVVGIGNIYANESLFLSGIHPKRPAGRISLKRYNTLAQNARLVLSRAIEKGGTTLRDFVNGSGEPGYFAQSLLVYGKADEACPVCQTTIQKIILGQRASYFCPSCQR